MIQRRALDLNIYNSIILAGIIQGFILSLFLFSAKKLKSKATFYLGVLILVFTLSNLQYSLVEMGVISTNIFFNIYFPYFFLVHPFLYFFVMYFLYPERTKRSKEKLLYIPFVFFFLISISYKVVDIFISKTDAILEGMKVTRVFIDTYSDFINIPLLLLVLVVLMVNISKYKKKNKEFDLGIIKKDLLWLKTLLITLLFIMLPWIYFTIQYVLGFEIIFLPLYASVSVVIYLLGYIGIRKIGINRERKKIREYIYKKRNPTSYKKQKNEHIEALENLLVQEKQFLDATLTLEKLADELNLSKSHLSRLINAELGISFTDYINRLRVEKAKEYLKNPEFSNYTLVAIGLEAGFNSKSTFNTAFKKVTQLTPSEYKKTS